MDNPYAPPESVITPIPLHHTEAEEIRLAHLSHEASVKSIGTLFYLGAILCFGAFFAHLSSLRDLLDLNRQGVENGLKLALKVGTALLILGFMVLNWKLAEGFRNLRPWVRIPTIILSIIGLLGFPIGTVISACILYFILSVKSKMIFSPEYRQIIADTPHVRYRSSILKTVFFVILVLVAFMAIGIFWRAGP